MAKSIILFYSYRLTNVKSDFENLKEGLLTWAKSQNY